MTMCAGASPPPSLSPSCPTPGRAVTPTEIPTLPSPSLSSPPITPFHPARPPCAPRHSRWIYRTQAWYLWQLCHTSYTLAICTPSLAEESKEGPSTAGVRAESLLSPRRQVRCRCLHFPLISFFSAVCRALRWQRIRTSFRPHMKSSAVQKKKKKILMLRGIKTTIVKYCITCKSLQSNLLLRIKSETLDKMQPRLFFFVNVYESSPRAKA